MNGHRQHVETATTGELGLNALDRLTRAAAVALSRRQFLKQISTYGAVIGLGLATVTSASAECRNYTDTGYSRGNCGCTSGGRCGYVRHKYTRQCSNCDGTVYCGAWQYQGSYCQADSSCPC